MNSIDFSQDTPIVHENCEGCDVCWCICPVEGASVITNMEKSQYLHVPTSDLLEETVKKYNLQDPPGGGMPMMEMAAPGESGPQMGEGGEGVQGSMSQAMRMPKFRQLLPDEEVGKRGLVMLDPNVPRIVLNKDDWPYHIKE